ncbi:MAG: methyltransferase, partial [candidate division WOR-3 bacterium]|nr:methyltransferase [candidate division WOR-3 bacterium]
SKIDFKNEDKVLDLGCGYGVVGILAAKLIGPKNVFMIDNDITAVKLAKENALLNAVGDVTIIHSDGFRNIEEKDFTLIITNPPYHEDFSVPKHFIEKGFNRLKLNGKIYLVTKRKDWYKNKLVNIFGGVQIWEIDDYYVFRSVKKAINYAYKKLIKRRNKTIPKS